MSRCRSMGILAVVLMALLGLSAPVNAASFDWRKANFWALSHAQDQQPGFNGCAWFVSNALWAGGLPKSKAWTDAGGQPSKRVGWLPGTNDVIAYDWDGNGHVDHVSLVVAMAPNSYPGVSEWGSAPDGKVSPYQFRGWSWSQNHGRWQKQVHPGVRAYLMMIR